METDIRGSALYQEAQHLYESLRMPGTGRITDAAEIHVSPCGRYAVLAGTLTDRLDGQQPTRICRIDLSSGDTRLLTFGPNTDRAPKYSPDGSVIAFLSDRHKPGDFQLYLLDAETGAARRTPSVDGWIEYLHWSPDGRCILLGVAGHGADITGGQGAIASKQVGVGLPGWMPTVDTGQEAYRWRRAWVYELAADRVRPVSPSTMNVWEANWCGKDALAAVASLGPGEGLWYTARLYVIAWQGGTSRQIYVPQDQLGWPAAAPSGKHLVIVEALCSDRWVVAGDLRIIETASGNFERVDTRGVDVTYTEWRSDRTLLLAGHRGFDTVVGVYDTLDRAFTQVWSSQELTSAGRYISVAGLNEAGDCVLVGESFARAPEIALIRGGVYRCVRSFDPNCAAVLEAVQDVQRVSWEAPDGLEIQGWLLKPPAQDPCPLIMTIHGGPVAHWRPAWLGRRSISSLMTLKRGYAQFLPNPRGSSGRGQQFARHVLGDMGGTDTYDYLSGLDHLVAGGIVDAARLGVTGTSYGGFMTAWLITQDSRFAAAIPVAPVTNHVTAHLLSNIPHFVAMFLTDTYRAPGGKYFARSPVMHAHKVKTPTLNICGSLDRCTPPEEAQQFHNALLENGVKSVLVTYPQEGHGVRSLPAGIDSAARAVAWLEEHMSAK